MQGSLDLRPSPVCDPRPGAPAPTALERLKARLPQIETPLTRWGVLPFGDERIDACLPGGGLPRGAWHEIGGNGGEGEIPAASTAFAASILARLLGDGVVFWVLQRPDIHPPGLAALGLPPDRVVYVRAPCPSEALAVMEDALRTRGVDAAVAETGSPDLVAGKRLQLAAARGGATGIVLRRQLFGRKPAPSAGAAVTRWRVEPAPSVADGPWLGPARWRVALERCRGGRSGAWLMESCDAAGDVRVLGELLDHPAPSLPHTVRDRAGGDGRRRTAAGGR